MFALVLALAMQSSAQQPPAEAPFRLSLRSATSFYSVEAGPSRARLAAAWPAAASDMGREGRVVMHCHIKDESALKDCSIASEEPAGSGLGAAALGLSGDFKLKNSLPRRVAPDPQVDVTIYFQPPRPEDHVAAAITFEPAPRRLKTVATPTAEDLRAALPATAKDWTAPWAVVLECRVTPDDRLSGCKPSSNAPPELGLDVAAIKVAESFRVHAAISPYEPVFAYQSAEQRQPVVWKPVFFWPASLAPDSAPHVDLVPSPLSPGGFLIPPDRVKWIKSPASPEFGRYYPERALRLEKSGSTMMTCRVTDDGGLEACRLDYAFPAGYAFDEAAMKIAPLLRMERPTGPDGEPVHGATIHVPVDFRAGD